MVGRKVAQLPSKPVSILRSQLVDQQVNETGHWAASQSTLSLHFKAKLAGTQKTEQTSEEAGQTLNEKNGRATVEDGGGR